MTVLEAENILTSGMNLADATPFERALLKLIRELEERVRDLEVREHDRIQLAKGE